MVPHCCSVLNHVDFTMVALFGHWCLINYVILIIQCQKTIDSKI